MTDIWIRENSLDPKTRYSLHSDHSNMNLDFTNLSLKKKPKYLPT